MTNALLSFCGGLILGAIINELWYRRPNLMAIILVIISVGILLGFIGRGVEVWLHEREPNMFSVAEAQR
jgi:xanthosine utilization system XapX-like protein